MSGSNIQNENACEKYVISASVDDIREKIMGRRTKAMFLVSVCWSDGRTCEILKRYKDFFDLQCSILDGFPVEGGRYNKERIIPFLPGRKVFRKDDMVLAQERKSDLDTYLKELIKTKPVISQSKLVLDFFQGEQPKEDNDVAVNKIGKENTTNVAKAENKTEGSTNVRCYVNASYNSDNEEKPHIC